MTIYGEYRYDNHTLLNPLTDMEKLHSVAYHEYTHFTLTYRSSVGMMLYCLEKIQIPPDSKNDLQLYKTLTGFLNEHTNKVQEGMAVFIQCIMILVSDGKDACQNFLEHLWIENEIYYKYVEPLKFIIDILQNEPNKDTILRTANIVFLLGVECMNSKIYELDPAGFMSAKRIRKMISSEGFAKSYLPDRRFSLSLKHCKMQNVKSPEDIEKSILPMLSTDTITTDYDKDQIRLEQIKTFILNYFSGSAYIKAYTNKLSRITMTETDVKDLYLQQLPYTFHPDMVHQKLKKVSFREMSERIRKKSCMLFLFGSLTDTFHWVTDKVGLTNEITYDKNYFQSHESAMIFDPEKRERLICLAESAQLQEQILSRPMKATLVTSYKNCDYVHDQIINHPFEATDLFIYCDRTYINAADILNKWQDRTLYYRYMIYQSMAVLLIKIAEKRYFFLPMTLIVSTEADKDIRYNRKNMVMAAKDYEDEGFDDHILTGQDMADKIDLIINCLFFMD